MAKKAKKKDEPELYRSVGTDEIRRNNWSLVPSKHIEFTDHCQDIDCPKEMARVRQEVKNLVRREKASQRMLEEAFRGIGFNID